MRANAIAVTRKAPIFQVFLIFFSTILKFSTKILRRYYQHNFQMAFSCAKGFYYRKLHKLEEFHSNEENRAGFRDNSRNFLVFFTLPRKFVCVFSFFFCIFYVVFCVFKYFGFISNCLQVFININLWWMANGNTRQKTKHTPIPTII